MGHTVLLGYVGPARSGSPSCQGQSALLPVASQRNNDRECRGPYYTRVVRPPRRFLRPSFGFFLFLPGPLRPLPLLSRRFISFLSVDCWALRSLFFFLRSFQRLFPRFALTFCLLLSALFSSCSLSSFDFSREPISLLLKTLLSDTLRPTLVQNLKFGFHRLGFRLFFTLQVIFFLDSYFKEGDNLLIWALGN